MHRPILVIALLLFLAPGAWAQVGGGQPVRIVPTQAEFVARATFDTSYLLALYMTELAAAGSPPTQDDIDEATRQYFTNGAAATGVPTSGPAAAYFTNGAEATGVPTSGPGAAYFHNGAEVMAYSRSPIARPPEEAVKAGAPLVHGEAYWEDAGVQRGEASIEASVGGATAQPAAPSEAGATATPATGLTCSRLEIEAAMAIARQFAAAAAAPAPATLCTPPIASGSAPPSAEKAPTFTAEPVPQSRNCPVQPEPSSPRRPSFLSPIAVALSGAFCGGLAVAFWSSRPRAIRVARRR